MYVSQISKDYFDDDWCQFELNLIFTQHILKKTPLIYIELGTLNESDTYSLMQYYIQNREWNIYHIKYPGEDCKEHNLFWETLEAIINGDKVDPTGI